VTKRDAAIAVTSAVVAGALCYALAVIRPLRPPGPSVATPPKGGSAGKVVMRINGTPVTEAEFMAFYRQLPEDLQQQYANEPGKMVLAEQTIRLKLLEQEAKRLGLERDPAIAAQLEANDANILATAAAEKLIAVPNDQAVQEFYTRNKGRFESADVSHILIAYQGGSIKPKSGKAPTLDQAKKKADAAYDQLKAGADFGAVARKISDDVGSAVNGGKMGQVSHGMLPPDLETKIFAAKTGDITTPTVTQFGVHIFKVEGRSTQSLDQLRAGIAQRVRQEKLRERVETLRKTAHVDFDPAFFPTTKKPATPKKPS